MPITSTPRAVVDEPRGTIYGLVDPRDGRLRYVGQTIKSVPRRLFGHLLDYDKPTRKGRWIAELKSLGLNPQIVAIGTYPIREVDAQEIALISVVRASGADLLNISAGGGGPRRRRRRGCGVRRPTPQWDRCISWGHVKMRMDNDRQLEREYVSDIENHKYAMREEE